MKISSGRLGHMIKKAVVSNYIFKNQTSSSQLTELKNNDLVTWNAARGLWPIIVCANRVPWLTLTYFIASPNLVSIAFIEGKVVSNIHQRDCFKTCNKLANLYNSYVDIKICTQDVFSPCLGTICFSAPAQGSIHL